MKRLLTFLTITLLFVVTVNAQQTQSTQVSIDKSMLTEQQLQLLESRQNLAITEEHVETISKWAGMGEEIGLAIEGGLNAVVDVSEKFGNTDVGMFTMAMIAWKIMGKDVVRIGLGLILAIIVTVVVFISWRRLTNDKVLIKSEGPWYKRSKVYEKKIYNNFINAAPFLLILILLASYGITYAIMFG